MAPGAGQRDQALANDDWQLETQTWKHPLELALLLAPLWMWAGEGRGGDSQPGFGRLPQLRRTESAHSPHRPPGEA